MGRFIGICGPIIAATTLIGGLGCLPREVKGDEWIVRDLRAAFIDHDKNPAAERCKAPVLTEKQVIAFFKTSRQITYCELMMAHSYSPCVLAGKHIWPDGNLEFEISASLVGRIFLPNQRVYFVCEEDCQKAMRKE